MNADLLLKAADAADYAAEDLRERAEYDRRNTVDGGEADDFDASKAEYRRLSTTLHSIIESFNGWPNWETWNVHLWLANTESHYRRIEVMRDQWPTPEGMDPKTYLGDNIREYVELEIGYHAGFVGDLVGHSLSQVHWYAIAEGFSS